MTLKVDLNFVQNPNPCRMLRLSEDNQDISWSAEFSAPLSCQGIVPEAKIQGQFGGFLLRQKHLKNLKEDQRVSIRLEKFLKRVLHKRRFERITSKYPVP